MSDSFFAPSRGSRLGFFPSERLEDAFVPRLPTFLYQEMNGIFLEVVDSIRDARHTGVQLQNRSVESWHSIATLDSQQHYNPPHHNMSSSEGSTKEGARSDSSTQTTIHIGHKHGSKRRNKETIECMKRALSEQDYHSIIVQAWREIQREHERRGIDKAAVPFTTRRSAGTDCLSNIIASSARDKTPKKLKIGIPPDATKRKMTDDEREDRVNKKQASANFWRTMCD